MAERILHQFAEGAFVGDAISDQVFIIQRWLRDLGFISEIYVEQIQPALEKHVRPAREYRPVLGETCLIHHHAIGSAIAERLQGIRLPQILIYHNITPAEFFARSNPDMAVYLKKGRQQMTEMLPSTCLALGDSHYNEVELRQAGFSRTGVLPIVLNEDDYSHHLNEALGEQNRATRPLLLFVGRFAPNKRQEDLIKLLYYVRRLRPDARLVLVGNTSDREYVDWQRALARDLGVDEAVSITGHVSHEDMITYYRTADLYVSMSEHEGFGKPLIESMYCGLPILAYASSAVPDTLGGAGILFNRKDYEALAELAVLLLEDEALRHRIIERQFSRVQSFLESQVRTQFVGYLRQLNLMPDVSSP